MMHSGHMCSEYWTQMMNHKHREVCIVCGEEESIIHILFKCNLSGHNVAWTVAKDLWSKLGRPWPTLLSVDSVARVAFPLFKMRNGKVDKGANYLYTILITKTAFLL